MYEGQTPLAAPPSPLPDQLFMNNAYKFFCYDKCKRFIKEILLMRYFLCVTFLCLKYFEYVRSNTVFGHQLEDNKIPSTESDENYDYPKGLFTSLLNVFFPECLLTL